MSSHGANNIQAAARIAETLSKQGYNVKISKPKKGKTKYKIITEGRNKKETVYTAKGRFDRKPGRIRTTWKSSIK